MKAATVERATAAAAAVKAKAKAAFEKIKPKFGERITIAGEPVYLDMPEDSKVHADRIYLKKHYLHSDEITENTKEVYRRFTAEKKVASCKKDDLDILQKGLSYRLQTVEAEAADLSEKRGNSVPLRQKLGHAQGLRDLLEVVKGEVLLCANKEAAADRRKAEEDAAAAAAALDNKPRGIEEKEIQTLVKKFAILILHASDPREEDRPSLNRPSKNLIAKLDTVPLLEQNGLETFIGNHMSSSPLLMRILGLGETGIEDHDSFYKTQFYSELLDKIRPTLDDKFTHDLPEDDSPQETIRKIINNILHLYYTAEEHITELTTEATGLQTRIDQLRAQLEVALKEAADMRDGDAAANKIIREGVEGLKAQLAAAAAELDDIRAQVAVQQAAVSTCNTQLGAAKEAATEAGVKAAARIAELEAASSGSAAEIVRLERAAEELRGTLAAAEAERDRVTGEVAGLQAQITTLEAGKSGGVQAAADAAAQIATLQKTIDARTKTLKGINERAIETGKERDAALAEVEKQKGEIASGKAELEALRATIQGHVTAKDAAIAERDAAKAAAAAAAATSKGIIDGLQRDAEAAKVAVAAAAAAAEDIKGKLTAKDAELNELREKLKTCEASLVAARSASATEAGAAAEARAALVAEKARLEGQITSVTAERDSFKRQQAEEAGKVLARNAELVTAQASAAALQAQIDKFNTEAVAAAEATQKRIAEFEGKIHEKEARLAAMGDEFRRQLDTAQAAAARGLAEQLSKKDADNAAAIRLINETLTESKRQLEKVRKEIVESQSAKNQVNTDLGTVRKALKNKNTEYTANLAAKEAQLLAANEKAVADLKAAKEAAAADKQKAVGAAAAALAAKTAELEGRIKAATDRVSQIQAEAAAAAAAAKAASDKEIAGLQTVQLKLRAEAAAMQANLRKAGADTEAAKKATAALEATNKEIAANLAEMTASKAKCDADAAAAAATAKAQIGNLSAQFRRQDEAAKQQGAQHAVALEQLRATHATALAAATAKAAADAKTAFDKRVADLGGEKATAIAAAEAAAKEAAGKQLAAELAKASAERQAAVDAARVEGRAAVTIEKDAAIDALKREGVAKEAAAVEVAKKAAKAEFVQREAALKAEMEAAVDAAKNKVTDEKKGELERALAAAAVAATAATAAAVDLTRKTVLREEAAKLTAEEDRSRAAADAARKEGSAAARAEDLEKLKDFAAKVLAGQAKAAEYAGDANKPLANILGKLDAMGSASSNDICALVYFVSYFLNTMIKSKIKDSFIPVLITNIKTSITTNAPNTNDLFNLIIAIQPALLLVNKIMREEPESAMDTMNYFITQTPENAAVLKTLISNTGSISKDRAWHVVRGEKGTPTSMRFYVSKDNKKIVFLYRPKIEDTVKPADKTEKSPREIAEDRKKNVRIYGADGILEVGTGRPVTEPERIEIDELERLPENKYITYEMLFLFFLYASKQYIVNNRASIACTIPMEIINNSVIVNPLYEKKGQAVAPAALTIRVPEAPTYAEVVVGSPGPPGSPPPAAAAPAAPKGPTRAELIRQSMKGGPAANLVAHMNAATAARAAPAAGKGPSAKTAAAAAAAVAKIDAAEQAKWAAAAAAQQAQRPATPLQLESLSAPPSPVASAPAAAAQSKCKNPAIISSISDSAVLGFGEKPIKYDRIILSPRLVEIFSKDPFCFTLKNGVELNYRQFNDALDGVINRFCSGENPTKLMIPPGFRKVNNKIVVEHDNACKTSKSTNEITCKLGDVAGDPYLEFVCPNQCSKLTPVKTTQPTMGNKPKPESGIVLGTTIAAGLKSYPFCIDVKGVASIQTINPIVYNTADLFSIINTKVGANGALPLGFTRDSATKPIKIDTKIGVWKSEGFYFVDGRPRGGRRTQKKKRNSKKFTQRKR